jgi:hypothetical protein
MPPMRFLESQHQGKGELLAIEILYYNLLVKLYFEGLAVTLILIILFYGWNKYLKHSHPTNIFFIILLLQLVAESAIHSGHLLSRGNNLLKMGDLLCPNRGDLTTSRHGSRAQVRG